MMISSFFFLSFSFIFLSSHLLGMTVLNSFLLLTSCGAETTFWNFRLVLVRNLIKNAGSLPHLCKRKKKLSLR
jgi:hypothetical protein